MKPKWIRARKREKKPCPGSMLQTGMLLFSATCGATLFFGGMQQQLEMKKPARLSGLFEFGSSYWT